MINKAFPMLPQPMHTGEPPLRYESALTMAADEERVLWIGNSLTFEHRLPRLLCQLMAGIPGAAAMGSCMITRGGADLAWHRQQGLAESMIRSGVWHRVIIQDQSTRPAREPDTSQADLCYFARLARQYGATPHFYCTWATADNPSLLEPLEHCYAQAATVAQCSWAPVGRAFALSLQQRPDLLLHREDHLHPTMAGSYLAACVWLGMCIPLPSSLPAQVSDIECIMADLQEDDADHLRHCAARALNERKERSC